jgi:3-hydroxyacyl-CoA dehydrogenase/enoyl-CoA hydratase/3-hydroxybutyryl-CoA epimerase
MPLVEIIRHDAMAPETEQRLAAFCKAIDKLPVPVAGTPGFLVNRVLFPYLLEAATAFAEGIPGRGDRQGRDQVRHADGARSN